MRSHLDNDKPTGSSSEAINKAKIVDAKLRETREPEVSCRMAVKKLLNLVQATVKNLLTSHLSAENDGEKGASFAVSEERKDGRVSQPQIARSF